MLDAIISKASQLGASDVHLEAGLPLALRVRGRLSTVGEPLAGPRLLSAARALLGEEGWRAFLVRRSADLSTQIGGTACRLNVFQTSRGVSLAIRLLAAAVPTLRGLNLHPDVGRLVERETGLVLVTGATGSGKSTTMAALVEHINRREARHILTIEAPIEYQFVSDRAFIRQREVGRDTPTFQQALLDALREDPDVLVVGEMRHRETMQLTLDAAETGHLVLATMHASSIPEALQRMVSAFPAEGQAGVRAQLADCFAGGLSQSLAYHPRHQVRIPECEIFQPVPAVRAHIRDGAFYKLRQAVETGASDGMWALERYRRWVAELARVDKPAQRTTAPPVRPSVALPPLGAAGVAPQAAAGPAGGAEERVGVIEVDDSLALDDVIAELQRR